MFIIPNVIEADNHLQKKLPKCHFTYLVLLFLFRSRAPHNSHMTADRLPPARAASNVCTTDARPCAPQTKIRATTVPPYSNWPAIVFMCHAFRLCDISYSSLSEEGCHWFDFGFSPDVFIIDVVLLGLASSTFQHSQLSICISVVCSFCVSFFSTAQ